MISNTCYGLFSFSYATRLAQLRLGQDYIAAKRQKITLDFFQARLLSFGVMVTHVVKYDYDFWCIAISPQHFF